MCVCTVFAEPVNVQPEWVHLLLPGVYQCIGAPRGGMGLRLVEGKEGVEAG
jgi:hypothetical protein